MFSAILPYICLVAVALSCFFLSDFAHSEAISTCNSQTKPSLSKLKRVLPISSRKDELERELDRNFTWRKSLSPKQEDASETASSRSSSQLLAALLESTSRHAKIVEDVTASEYFRLLVDRFKSNALSNHAQTHSSASTKRAGEAPSSSAMNSTISKHYACPPSSVDTLRRRYGTSTYFGDWSVAQTRRFYKSQLPKALLIDGALGLNLEERARLASEARHALRLYSRERSIFIARLLAELYDGVRHLQSFGYWSSQGMTWEEVKTKYRKEAKKVLGEDVSDEIIDRYVYLRIIERACATNSVLDDIAQNRIDFSSFTKVLATLGKSADKNSIPSFLRDFLPLLLLTMPDVWTP